MSNVWPMGLREDRVRVEILCPHGIGHPSMILSNQSLWKEWMYVHGCDGCCSHKEFYRAEVEHKIHQLRTSDD